MAVALIDFGAFESGRIFGWNLASGETGVAAMVAYWPDKTVQIYGTFGTGNVQIEGALDPPPATPTYAILRDVPGAAISAKVAAYCEAIQQHVALIRPVATTVTAVSIRIICSSRRVY